MRNRQKENAIEDKKSKKCICDVILAINKQSPKNITLKYSTRHKIKHISMRVQYFNLIQAMDTIATKNRFLAFSRQIYILLWIRYLYEISGDDNYLNY